jgi:Protein of unknown function (DUF664)
MTHGDFDPKGVLRRYLQAARSALVWKLDGISDYDVRRPMTGTGTNLLGLVKHMAYVEAGYFGSCFDRPFPEPMTAWEGDDPTADMWAGPEETRADVVELYERVQAHADVTIEELALETKGRVPWWGAGNDDPDLHTLLVHVVAEINRHAGHADIARELIDGSVGMRATNSNLPDYDEATWADHVARLEALAQASHGRERPDR